MGETNCQHESFGYFPAINEAGWRCLDGDHLMPGDPNGYRPDLDRSHTEDKVYGMMNDLHEGRFIYISNGTGGDICTGEVAKRCRETGLYDQISIIRFILEIAESGHAAYWKTIGDGIVSGNDPRDRCHCGKLATSYSSRGRLCSEHGAQTFAETFAAYPPGFYFWE
jgi:hypothetical protein